MKSTSDLPHEIFFASSNVALFQKLSYLLLAMQFEYKIKLKVNIKKHWKKQQKDYQNHTKYLQDGRFSIPIGFDKRPKLPARNANRTILKNRYILCLLISTKKNQNNQNLKIEQTLLLKWQSARKHLQIKP